MVNAFINSERGNYPWRHTMLKLLKILINAWAFIGIALVCANGYQWYTTGHWEMISLSDLLNYVSGNKVRISKLDPMFFYNLVN